jgi:hypothetical protein
MNPIFWAMLRRPWLALPAAPAKPPADETRSAYSK